MLRFMRITGIVVFAVLIGLSANSLKQMHESGELFEKYNSSRRANITLLSFSLIALGALGFFEIVGIQRKQRRQRYGERRHQTFSDEDTEGLDSTSIYASNRKSDDWERKRHTKYAKAYDESPKLRDGLGMRFLRSLSVVLPILYAFILGFFLMNVPEDTFLGIFLPSLFAALLTISLIASVGINRKKTWGLTFGYILALFNLVIFPVGTAIGLLLILALVASGHEFAKGASKLKRDSSRYRSSQRSSVAAI